MLINNLRLVLMLFLKCHPCIMVNDNLNYSGILEVSTTNIKTRNLPYTNINYL